MPHITIHLYGALKADAKRDRIIVNASNAMKAVDALCVKLGNEFKEHLYDGGRIKPHYIFLLNGEVVDINGLNKVKLKKYDILHIIAPVGGG